MYVYLIVYVYFIHCFIVRIFYRIISMCIIVYLLHGAASAVLFFPSTGLIYIYFSMLFLYILLHIYYTGCPIHWGSQCSICFSSTGQIYIYFSISYFFYIITYLLHWLCHSLRQLVPQVFCLSPPSSERVFLVKTKKSLPPPLFWTNPHRLNKIDCENEGK